MFQLFQKIPIHVKFYPNEIEVTRIDTGKSIKRKSKFSTSRLVISDFRNAEKHLTQLVKELIEGKSLVTNRVVMILQQMAEYPDGLSEVEKRALRDLAEQAGAIEAYIIDHSKEVDNLKLRELVNKNYH